MLSQTLQENLIILLIYDKQSAQLIRNTVELDLFEGIHRDLARAAFNFLDRYNVPPEDHIYDELEHIINGSDKRKGERYANTIVHMHDAYPGLNKEYVIGNLERYVRQQSIKKSIVEAVELLKSPDEDALDKIESVLSDAAKKRLTVFDPGTYLGSPRSLAYLDSQDTVAFPTGIEALDSRGLGPARKELFMFMALPKMGKSWLGVNLGRRAIMAGHRVVHVTLEMSADKMLQRYHQNIYGVAKRRDPMDRWELFTDQYGSFTGFDEYELIPHLSYSDPNIRSVLSKKINKHGNTLNRLIVKEFPTDSLKMNHLEAYLDMLEQSDGFIPDMIILDYMDLMNIDPGNYRLELSKHGKALRGLGVKRNCAMVTFTQGSRAGEGAKILERKHVAEDYSKLAVSDVLITYSQTPAERKLGLARLLVGAGRNDEDGFQILISQNYATGQFVLGSARIIGGYDGNKPEEATGIDGEE